MLMTMLNTDRSKKKHNEKRKRRSAPKASDGAKQLTSGMEEDNHKGNAEERKNKSTQKNAGSEQSTNRRCGSAKPGGV